MGNNKGSVPAPNGRYVVNLDLLDASTPNVSVKPVNMKREATITRETESKRAPVVDACLTEAYGRPICVILDVVRFICAKYIMGAEGVEDMKDIERMRYGGGQRDMQRLNQFLAMGWSHWLDPGGFRSVESVYAMAKEWAQTQLAEGIEMTPDSTGDAAAFVKFISSAFDDITSVKSWHVRVHGDFWVVGSDNEGTFLIPLENHDIVYQVVGLTKNLSTLVQTMCGDTPAAFTVTMIPVNGRLLYDGAVAPAGGIIAGPKRASTALTSKLRATVSDARESGRVVQRLRQLEVEGGSLEGLPTQGNTQGVTATDEDKKPATTEETKLVEKISKHTKTFGARGPKGSWVFRRFGYTEQDNPEHFGVIIADGDIMGQLRCAHGIAPVATDILASTAHMCIQSGGFRPTLLMVDERSCCERLKVLFRGVCIVEYYHPPTPEETSAAINKSM